MMHTVDPVVLGADAAAIAATIDAVQRGERVLVVIRSSRRAEARQVRRVVTRSKGLSLQGQFCVVTGADVACVDGVNAVEAIVVRRRRTGRLVAFNASAILDFRKRIRPGSIHSGEKKCQ